MTGALVLAVMRSAMWRGGVAGKSGGAGADAEQQLFSGPNGRFYLKGTEQMACSVYADDAKVTFAKDRIVVKVKTRARMGKSMAGSCIGIALSPTVEVSMAPYGEGESSDFATRS